MVPSLGGEGCEVAWACISVSVGVGVGGVVCDMCVSRANGQMLEH